jgi:hypothetical protein
MTDQQPAAQKHPLEGAGLHWKNEHGGVQYQATIIKIVPSGNANIGDLALIQYYEWISGTPSTQRLIPLVELATSQWVFYSSAEEMNDHYERVGRHQNEHIQRRLAEE